MGIFSFLLGESVEQQTAKTSLIGLQPQAMPATNNWLDLKGIFNATRVGIRGRAQKVDADTVADLLGWQRRNELAYACIEKIAQCAIDPELTVEERNSKGVMETSPSHPLARLFTRPNPEMDGAAFVAWWLVSLHVSGWFYAEIERGPLGLPKALWPLNPAKIRPIASGRPNGAAISAYEWRDGTERVVIPAEDVFVDRFVDIGNPYGAVSPLSIALGACDMDSAQTDFIRSFFDNGGVPSGVIRVLNRTLKKEESESILAGWMAKYRRGGRYQNAPAVLDQNAEYQKIGSSLDELKSNDLREHAEARICTAFGVPPVLVGALVGLRHQNNRASAQAAQADLWANKMSPLFKRMRTVLKWRLLPEFVGEDAIHAGLIALNWDMSQVVALQEDETARRDRARKDLVAGGTTLNEYREQIGLERDPGGDYYLRTKALVPITPEAAGAAAATANEPPPKDDVKDETAGAVQ